MASFRFMINTFVAIFAISLLWDIFSYSTCILMIYILGDALRRKVSKEACQKSVTVSNAATFEWKIVEDCPTKRENYVFFLFPDITISVDATLQEDNKLDIWLNRLTPKLSDLSVFCEISLIDNGIEKIKESNSVTFQKNCDRIHFMTYAEEIKDCSPNNLNIRCEISCRINNPETFISKGLSRDIVSLLDSAIHADVIFEVMNERIPAHKAILSARSKAFADMFQEVKTVSSIYIDDVKPFIFRLLLQYVYSGNVLETSNEDNYSLYAAADKYSICNLKEECIYRMLAVLSVDNVCNYLLMADRYADKTLKDGVFDFFRKNGKFFLSEKWDEFSRNNSSLAVETLNVYIKFFLKNFGNKSE